MQEQNPTLLVGMDLHSRKVQLCLTGWTHGSDPVRRRSISTTLDALENTYLRQIPPEACTLVEASTNSYAVARRLQAIGRPVKVLVAEIASGLAAPDRVNDAIDAYNIVLGYVRRANSDHPAEVYVPSPLYQDYRDIYFAYCNATRDAARCANRIWAYCSEHLLLLPGASTRASRDPERLRDLMDREAWSPARRFALETLLADYEHAAARRESCRQFIARTVAATPSMRLAMTVLGVNALTAFALMAFVEDVRRFATPKKLVSYLGLNPCVNESGKKDGHAPRRLTSRGRLDLRVLLIEGAQSAFRCGREPMHKWARRRTAAGMPHNKALVGLARRMVTALWHALMEHPIPAREPEACFRHKLALVARRAGSAPLRDQGFEKASAWIDSIATPLYAHLPPLSPKPPAASSRRAGPGRKSLHGP